MRGKKSRCQWLCPNLSRIMSERDATRLLRIYTWYGDFSRFSCKFQFIPIHQVPYCGLFCLLYEKTLRCMRWELLRRNSCDAFWCCLNTDQVSPKSSSSWLTLNDVLKNVRTTNTTTTCHFHGQTYHRFVVVVLPSTKDFLCGWHPQTFIQCHNNR